MVVIMVVMVLVVMIVVMLVVVHPIRYGFLIFYTWSLSSASTHCVNIIDAVPLPVFASALEAAIRGDIAVGDTIQDELLYTTT